MIYFSRWKQVLIGLICLGGIVMAGPNFYPLSWLKAMPSWLPHERVNLGLDLRGGAHLLLEVEIDEVVAERLDNDLDNVRIALRRADIGYKNLSRTTSGITFHLIDKDKVYEARTALRQMDGGNIFDVSVQDSGAAAAFILSLSQESLRNLSQEIINQSIEVVRNRIDETGTREPTIQQQGKKRILVQLPGEDPERIKALLGRTAKLNFHMVDDTTLALAEKRGGIPAGAMRVLSASSDDPQDEYIVRKKISLSGERLTNATATLSSQRAEYVVSVTFDASGARQFGRLTRDNVSKRLAILLDGQVISAPVINEAISGGNAEISGSFTAQSANDLALLLRAGALPAPLNVIEERSVGPSLGADSILSGKIASLVGLILVIAFMAVAYGLFGLFADVALMINLVLILGVLSWLQATLTLPGIAGIVLTVGMAVDANVLIFERIREELAMRRTPVNAVEHGYRQALHTIIDANVTTLIAALLLYVFGSGPIKGFAVTLSIGICTSMFTAIMVTRLLIVWWLRSRRPKALPL